MTRQLSCLLLLLHDVPEFASCVWCGQHSQNHIKVHQFSSVVLSLMSDCLRPHGLQHARLSCHHQLPEPTQIMSMESVMPSNHLILCLCLLLPSVFPSIRVFTCELVLHIRWPKYWHFSFSISPSSEYSGLTFFMIDWLDLLAVQGTLKSLL